MTQKINIRKYRGVGGFWWCVSCGRGRNYRRIGDFRTEAEAKAAAEAVKDAAQQIRLFRAAPRHSAALDLAQRYTAADVTAGRSHD
jgi:hypothetical protein